MEEEVKTPVPAVTAPKIQPARSAKSKAILKKNKNTKYVNDPEEEKRFEQLKRKYANAIAFLLVKNVPQSQLRTYFNENEETRLRYDTLKRFRQNLIEARPKAK